MSNELHTRIRSALTEDATHAPTATGAPFQPTRHTPSGNGHRSGRLVLTAVMAAVIVVGVGVGVFIRSGSSDNDIVTAADQPGDTRTSEIAPSTQVPTSTTAAALTLESVPGRSTADSPEQRRVEEAAFFRLNLVNQTGQQHLSLSDYAEIRDEVCAGAVNDTALLVELSRRWGLGARSSDEAAAGVVWGAARNTCPEAFDDQDFTQGQPFGSLSGGGEPLGDSGPPPSGAQVAFVDTSVLDDPQWGWSGEQMILIGITALAPEETIEHFRAAFADGWTVNEILGPVTPLSGPTFWSLDVSGDNFSGALEVMRGDELMFVSMAVVDGPYPLPAFVVDPRPPALDGELDCLTEFTWTQQASFPADATGPTDPETALEESLERYRSQYDLDPVTHIRRGVGSLTVHGREVIIGFASPAPARGYIVGTMRSCGPYPFN